MTADMTTATRADFPIVIAGGGLVGLSLSLFLGRLGVPALLVEQHTGTSVLPRGRGFNLRTMELYRWAGAEDALRAAPASVLRDLTEVIRAETLSGPESFRSSRPAPDGFGDVTPAPPLTIDQDVAEPIVRAHAERYGQRLAFHTRLVDFRPGADGVEVDLLDRATGAVRLVRCRYLVAADGHRSAVRRALGIGLSGHGEIAHYVNIPFDADLSGPLRGRRMALAYLDRPAPSTMLTRIDGPRRWILMVPYRPDAGESPADFGPDRCRDLIRDAVGGSGVRPRILEDLLDESGAAPTWSLASWVADRFRAGRVFLAGDAAHVTPPAGGLGGNLGVQDAHNLAWKLAAVLGGRAGPALLGTYADERRAVAELTGAYSLGKQLSRNGGGPGTAGPGQLAMTMGYRYRSAAVCAEPGGSAEPDATLTAEPGSRAPHVVLDRDGAPMSTIDLYGDGFVLVAGPEADVWTRAAGCVAAEADLRVVHVGRDVGDPGLRWASAHGVTARGAVLVRPDGFVAWRTVDGPAVRDPARVLRGVLRRVLGH